MVIKVGINGFGRVGRVVFRTCMESPDIKVTALNDPAIDVDYITYLIKFDSTHGNFKGSVINNKKEVIVNGTTIKVFCEEFPDRIPWASAEVQYVVEASGMFTSFGKASGHMSSEGVRRVIVAAPSTDVPMIVLGVNHTRMTPDMSVISGASSTLYCLAPIVKVLEDNFGLSEGFVTSIHAMTPSLKPLDGLCMRGKHWRDHRSIHQNIIPANTGACKALGKIMPKTKDRLAGIAFRVPIVDVSALDITVRLAANTTLQNIIKCVEQASATYLKRIIKTSNEGAVSSDFIGDSYSCILDVESCIQLRPNFYKLICWYENEYSYANRIVNTIVLSEDASYRPMYPLKLPSAPRKPTSPRGKGDQASVSEETPVGTKSKAFLRRGQSPDCSRTKKTDLFKIGSDFSSTKSSPTPSIRLSKPSFLANLVAVTAPPTAAKLSPECLKKLNRDFAKPPPNKPMLDAMEPIMSPKPPELNEVRSLEQNDANIKANKHLKERHRNVKQGRSTGSMPQSRCDNIQMAAVLCDLPSRNSGSSQTLQNSIYRIPSLDNVSKHGSVSKSEPSQKMPKKEMNLDRRKVVTEIESHPIHAEIATTSHAKEHTRRKPSTKSVASTSPSDLPDSELAKTIDLFVDGLTQDQMLQTVTKTSSDQRKESSKLPSLIDILAENMNGLADLFTSLPQKGSSMTNQIPQRALSQTVSKNSVEKPADPREDCHDSETSYTRAGLDVRPSTQRSTLVIDIQQQYDGGSEDTLSDADMSEQLPETIQTIGSLTHTLSSVSKKRADIYDKVDSASLSDSDNSFYVNERKSEVINVTDLTRGTSLEDLQRLDKICRIMEISDELSDKLFSSLPKAENAGLKDKWSFKELCEKIKFDDFCKTVFNK